MIDLGKILDQIDAELERKGLTAAEVSRKATGSPDTIRNWKRSYAASGGEVAAATVSKINQIEKALGIALATNAPVESVPPVYRTDAEIREVLEAIDGLPDERVDIILRLIRSFVQENELSSRSQGHDQSELATRRRVAEPST